LDQHPIVTVKSRVCHVSDIRVWRTSGEDPVVQGQYEALPAVLLVLAMWWSYVYIPDGEVGGLYSETNKKLKDGRATWIRAWRM
jgi:hypothetical protein